MAWFAVFVALASVRISISAGQPLWWVLYLLGQWAFLVLLSTGCRELTGRRSNLRVIARAIPFACLVAVAIVVLSPTFNHVFTIEAGIVALGAACAFHSLGHFSVGRQTSGWRILRLACLVMAAQYALYVPLFALEHLGIINNGVEDTESAEAKSWAPAYENYTFVERNGGTELTIEMDIEARERENFEKLWADSLTQLKEIAEA